MTPSQFLSRFPKVKLAHTPTPLEPLNQLSTAYGATQLYIKRDDCTGLAMGGNKARQLEYYFGKALDQGCDTVLSTGAVQSNYMRMLAAAAAKLGLQCHIQLETRVDRQDADYLNSGNVLLDRLLGAYIHHYLYGEDESGADRQLTVIADQLSQQGRKPYIIPLGADHFPTGALGYVEAAGELIEQLHQRNITADLIVVGSGSGMTHAGLLFGLRLHGSPIPVLGVCVRRSAARQQSRIQQHCRRLGEQCSIPDLVSADQIWLDDRSLAPGYGVASDAVVDTVKLLAMQEGLLLDPVYTGKTMACLLTGLDRGELDQYRNIVMIHTGGTPALFAYRDIFSKPGQ